MKNNTHTMKTPSPILEKRTPNLRQRRTGALALLALLALAGGTLNAVATDGTWSNAAGGAYDTAANWSGGVNIADGVGATGRSQFPLPVQTGPSAWPQAEPLAPGTSAKAAEP